MITPNEIRRALSVLTPENYHIVRQYNSAVGVIKRSGLTEFDSFDSGVVINIKPRKKAMYSRDDVIKAILNSGGDLDLAEDVLDELSSLETEAKYINIPGA